MAVSVVATANGLPDPASSHNRPDQMAHSTKSGSPKRYERHITAQPLSADLFLLAVATVAIARLTSHHAVGETAQYLTDGLDLEITSFEGMPLGVELPINVEIEVVETEPGVRGDTATGATKMARVATGLEVQVPLFVETGDVLRIDSRNGEYQTRV